MSGPLEGVKVLELVQKGPGAFVTMMLCDMGAEVVKIEAPDRGKSSGSGGSAAGANAKEQAVNIVNRGKKSLILDLKAKGGQAALLRLAATMDVLVEGFRPGVTARLSADYETLSNENRRLIYCSLSGFGQDGPYRDLPGHDINYIGIAGILDLIGEEGAPPVVPPNLIADYGGAAMHAVAGISMALFARERTGRGQHVDISYLDSALSLISSTRAVRDYVSTGGEAHRGVGALGGSYPYYGVYQTKDGKYLTIGCVEPWLWENLCRVLGRPDLADAGSQAVDFSRGPTPRQAACRRELEAVFKTRSRDAWFELLCREDVCVGKVNSIAEVFDDPQLRHRNMVIRSADPELGEVLQIGIPIKLSDTPGAVRGPAPWKGQHGPDILGSLGYSPEDITRLGEGNFV